MFTSNVKLAAIASSFIPVLVGASLIYFFRAHKGFKVCDEQEGVLSTYAQENLTGVRVVRAFGKERYERDKFEKQTCITQIFGCGSKSSWRCIGRCPILLPPSSSCL